MAITDGRAGGRRPMPKTDRLPRALYRAAQVRELDRLAIETFGIAGGVLMERAGAAALAVLRERWPAAVDLTVLVGTGNNGGDGFVLARLARAAGLDVRVLQLGERSRIGGDAALQADRYVAAGGAWRDFDGRLPATDVIVDGMLGTGLERPVAGAWATAIAAANGHRAPVLALDIPSGLHADSGRVLGSAVRADLTLSFIGLKCGMFTGAGPDCCGEVRFDALAVPARVYASQILAARRLDSADLAEHLPRRPRTAHKGHFGHVLVVGGERGLAGAARLAAEAAGRVGAGLVSLATRPEHAAAVVAARPEIMACGIDAPADVDALLARATVVAIGPGLGGGAWGQGLWDRALDSGLPLVVDADALNWAGTAGVRRADWVLTPHPGEAGRLLGRSVAAVQADRFAAAEALVARFGGCAVLKGAGTLVQSASARPPGVCGAGNPGMASGGMGDVLTGVIAGLLAQGLEPEHAAELGVCLHAAAADAAAVQGERGMLAGDLMPALRRLANPG
jgi:hydroxyethylthiazole kinase-like uncharacterized protein yjeF